MYKTTIIQNEADTYKTRKKQGKNSKKHEKQFLDWPMQCMVSKYTANGLKLFNNECQKTFLKACPNEALGTIAKVCLAVKNNLL